MVKSKTATNEAIFHRNETPLKHTGAYFARVAEINCLGRFMFDFVAAVLVLTSASIFFAHLVDAYLTHQS
jgi:hypothetical protein